MNKKIFLIIIPVIISIILILSISEKLETSEEAKTIEELDYYSDKDTLFNAIGTEGENYYVDEEGKRHWMGLLLALNENVDYSDVMNQGNAMFIVPVFTGSAYNSPGFYDYYRGQCDVSCLTVKIEYPCRAETSCIGSQVLKLLGYDIYSDVEIDQNPEILNQYDTVMVLHNEYVTQKQFDAVTSHPNVLYLYPNANYGLVTVDYETETITLVRGHGYPESTINNGFDWKYENTPMEYDKECREWEFYNIDNGKMLNCYPDTMILHDMEFLKTIKELTS